MTPTKEQFLNHLREKWVSRFGWAHDKTKLENALAEAANTLNGKDWAQVPCRGPGS